MRRVPTIGLVLSGGGAKGLAHIGVLQVLEAEGIVPKVVTGTSIGALVGGLYAIGHSAATLDSLVTGLDWASYFLDAPARRFLSLDRRFSGERTIASLPFGERKIGLPSGAITGQRISELLARLTWPVQTERDFRRFPIPFSATATDIETGETVVLDHGSLARALRASMSIPSLLSPVLLEGRVLIDGGITRNLPAMDARALGADLIICSDVSDRLLPASRLKSLVDVLAQTVTIYMHASNVTERALCDIYIQPETADLTAADFNHADAWIARGRDAANEVRAQLRALAGRVPPSPRLPSRSGSDSVRVATVVVHGVTGAAEQAVRQRLRLPDAGFVSAVQLDSAVQRVYATELFDEVTYRLEARGADTAVVVDASIRNQDRIGLGLRYDDSYDASLLVTLTLHNRLGFGSTTEFDVRIGEQLRIAMQHAQVGIGQSRIIAGSMSYSRTPLPVYIGDKQVAQTRTQVSNATALIGVLLGDRGAVGVELKGEDARAYTAIGAIDSSQHLTFASGAAVLRWDTFDRSAFPSSGGLVSLRTEYAFGGASFTHHVANGAMALPLSHSLTALGRATVGASSPDSSLPVHYRFMLGGSYPAPLFPETQVANVGLRLQERSGDAVSRVGVGLQWEARSSIFATVRTDVGYAGHGLTFDRDKYETGVGVALGALTPVGPLELSASGRRGGGRPRLELSFGYPF